MKLPLLNTLFASAALIIAAQTTAAQTTAAAPRTCGDHALVVERLATGFGETRQSIGLAGNNTVIEVFASLETGTWTLTMTAAGGPTCLMASGVAFQHLNAVLPVDDEGA